MKRVLLIGNNANEQEVHDGGSIKVRLYKECLEKCGHEVIVVDLFKWKKHLFKKISEISKGVKSCDVILIMGGPNGSRKLIPLVNHFNKKHKKRVVYCPLGIGTVEKAIERLSPEQANRFINCEEFYGITDSKIEKHLKRIDCVIPQNDKLMNLYQSFYHLDNVKTLLNFRNIVIPKRNYIKHSPFKIIYLSRVNETKGVFLLMEAVNALDEVKLDIFGDLQLSAESKKRFSDLISNSKNITYQGTCDPEDSVNLLGQYDLFCLPTQYKGEGTSGAFIESLIAGTPALLSSYSLANHLVSDGENGFIFKLGDLSDLKQKIMMILKKDNLNLVSAAAQESSKKYLFEYNKKDFESLIVG